MKVLVTFLAAPWPAGTVPGHVVELAGCDAIPAWAVGKCEKAADDAEAVSVWTRPGFVAPAILEAAAPAAPAAGLVVNPAPAAPARKKAQAAAG
jgi:hypothetical protein